MSDKKELTLFLDAYYGWRDSKEGYETVDTHEEHPPVGPDYKVNRLKNGVIVEVRDPLIEQATGLKLRTVAVTLPNGGYHCFQQEENTGRTRIA